VILFNFFEDSDVSRTLWQCLCEVAREGQAVASHEDRALARLKKLALQDPQYAPLATEVHFFIYKVTQKPDDQRSSNFFTSP
jgi:hypothetical protein